jgi:GTP-binding protein
VYVSTTSDLSALNKFTGIKKIKAEDGVRGGDRDATGRSGEDTEIYVPIGTSIVNTTTGRTIELDTLGERILLCKGGLGGRGGNFRAQAGLPGESIEAKFVLKLIAKYGFIGLPNAGKSSLLNELTNARAQVGAYPFTTLEPNLGVLKNQIIADIPGLIEGASEGRGLGIKFLKHIEKVSLLFHCIACDSHDVVKDYESVKKELTKFGAGLSDKSMVIVLTKTDLVSPEIIQNHLKALKKFKQQIVTVSIHDLDSLEAFKSTFF